MQNVSQSKCPLFEMFPQLATAAAIRAIVPIINWKYFYDNELES